MDWRSGSSGKFDVVIRNGNDEYACFILLVCL